MTHNDWLYLIEMQLKHGGEEAAKTTIDAMKRDSGLRQEETELLARLEKKIRDAGFIPHYFKP